MMFKVSVHDGYPPQETALVDYGLGEANDGAAPLHEVQPCHASRARKVDA